MFSLIFKGPIILSNTCKLFVLSLNRSIDNKNVSSSLIAVQSSFASCLSIKLKQKNK